MIRFLYGENSYASDEAVRVAKSTYLSQYDSFGFQFIDGEDTSIDVVRDALLQLPFLVSRKLVVIQHVFASKALIEALQMLLEQVPEEIDVLLCDTKPDKRTKLFKLLEKMCKKEEFKPLDSSQLLRFASTKAQEMSLQISDQFLRLVVERSGADQYRLVHDLEVLALQEQPVTQEIIIELIQPSLQGTVFQLLEYAFAGQVKLALKLYDELLLQKVDPVEIIAMIGWQLHILVLIKTAGNRSAAEIASAGKIHPFVVSKSMAVVRQLTLADIKELCRLTLEADLLVKTSAGSPADTGRLLVLDVAQIKQ